MRTTLAWSYDLLSSADQHLFRQLAVFRDGWTLDAAEAVLSAEHDADTVLHGLVRLVDASLVVAYEAGDAPRFRFLEPIRQYALEQLDQQGGADAVRDRHAAYFLALTETAAPRLRGPDQVVWLERLEQEHGNLSAAMRWLIDHGDLEAAARLGYNVWLVFWLRGHFSEGQRWMEQVVAGLPATPSLARAQALLTLTMFAYGQADYVRAAPLADACLAQYRSIKDDEGIAWGMCLVALVAAGRGQVARALPLMEEAVEQCVRVGNTWSAAMLLTHWAPILLHQGNHARAAELAQQALDLARALGDRIAEYAALYNLALVAHAAHDYGTAHRLFGDALVLAQAVGDASNVAACFKGLGGVAAARGATERAAQVWGVAEALLETREAAVYAYTVDRAVYEQLVAAARAQLGDAAFAAAWAAGKAMRVDHAIAYALASDHTGP